MDNSNNSLGGLFGLQNSEEAKIPLFEELVSLLFKCGYLEWGFQVTDKILAMKQRQMENMMQAQQNQSGQENNI